MFFRVSEVSKVKKPLQSKMLKYAIVFQVIDKKIDHLRVAQLQGDVFVSLSLAVPAQLEMRLCPSVSPTPSHTLCGLLLFCCSITY